MGFALAVVALILAAVETIRSRGQSLLAYAVGALAAVHLL